MRCDAGGYICVAVAGDIVERLKIPMMVQTNNSQFETPFTVSVEAASNITTGVSIKDRVHSIKTLISQYSCSDDIVMPGHISPLRAHDKGVLARGGHTEGSVDLMRLSGLQPAAVI